MIYDFWKFLIDIYRLKFQILFQLHFITINIWNVESVSQCVGQKIAQRFDKHL